MEIGQKVIWKVGRITRQGVFMQDNQDGTYLIMCTHAENSPMALKMNVSKSLVQAQEV